MATGTKNPNSSRKQKRPIDEKSALLLEEQSSGENSAQEFDGASFAGAVFNLSTTIIGAGIMSLPATMKVLGLVPGVAMIVFIAILTEASVEMLLRFSRVGKSVTYGGVVGDSFGRVGRFLFQLCILLNNLGILIVYMIIIGDVLSGSSKNGVHHFGVLEGWFGDHWWNGRAFVLFVTTIAVFAPLACLKRIDSLKYTSTIAVALAVVFLVITAGIAIIKLVNGSIGMPRLLPLVTDITSVWKLFTVVPVLVTAFICHFNGLDSLLNLGSYREDINTMLHGFVFVGVIVFHSIDNELEDVSLIKPVVRTSLALCASVYILTSFFGYLLFGDSTFDDVLANFDTDLGIPYSSVLNDAVRISYALHLVLVFPIIFYPLRLNIDDLLFPSARPLVSDNHRFSLITIGLISITLLGAIFIPSVWDVFEFTGATATVCIAYIFPAAIALKDPHGIATKKDKILSVFMIVLAVFSNLLAIYSNVNSLLAKA